VAGSVLAAARHKSAGMARTADRCDLHGIYRQLLGPHTVLQLQGLHSQSTTVKQVQTIANDDVID